VISALLTAMSCFGFFGLMWFYRSRLEFNIVVPLFVLAGIFLRDILEKGPAQGAARQLILPGLAAFAYITVALVTINWPY
jgi:predicted membrane-bound mannosyltransferase